LRLLQEPTEVGPRRRVAVWARAHVWALAELFALSGLVIAQPVLDVTGRSPDFFLFRQARVRLARQDGVTRSEPVVEPRKRQSRLEPGGCGPVSSARRAPNSGMVRGDSEGHDLCDQGGHGEGLRRTRGEAAGEKLGTTLPTGTQ
jgi:hypothetical protein